MRSSDWQHVLVGVQSCLSKLLLFGKVDFGGERRIAAEMYERSVVAGEILIKEGDTGGQPPRLASQHPSPLQARCERSPACPGCSQVPGWAPMLSGCVMGRQRCCMRRAPRGVLSWVRTGCSYVALIKARARQKAFWHKNGR